MIVHPLQIKGNHRANDVRKRSRRIRRRLDEEVLAVVPQLKDILRGIPGTMLDIEAVRSEIFRDEYRCMWTAAVAQSLL